MTLMVAFGIRKLSHRSPAGLTAFGWFKEGDESLWLWEPVRRLCIRSLQCNTRHIEGLLLLAAVSGIYLNSDTLLGTVLQMFLSLVSSGTFYPTERGYY